MTNGGLVYEQLYGKTGLLAIVGSGFMWAWFDAFYMSSLFPTSGAGLASELCAAATFFLTIPVLLLALARPGRAGALLSSTRGVAVVGAAGTLGSLALVGADVWGLPALAAGACVPCALFMAFATVAWGAVYSQGGSITATPYVAGAFAFAIVLDLPLFFMVPLAASVFYASFPLVSCALFLVIDLEDRTYASVLDVSAPAVAASRARRPGRPRAALGIPLTIAFGYVLVMLGFAYFQHLISFSPVVSGGHAYGILVQAVRGAAAILMFLVVWRDPGWSRFVYRVGLPLMIAGCLLLTLTFNSGLFVVSASMIIAGYTAFDLFVWVIFSSIACTQSENPLGTIVAMRVVCAAGHSLGALAGMALVGFDAGTARFLAEATTIAGYCVVIAAVLLLSSEEVFALSNGYFDFHDLAASLRRRLGGALADAGEGSADEGADADASVNDLLDARFAELGLTAREADVARQLTHGRTQKWIADYLCISQNTVGTHLRRIYQKAGVHTRQQFLDVLAGNSPTSHETRDAGCGK